MNAIIGFFRLWRIGIGPVRQFRLFKLIVRYRMAFLRNTGRPPTAAEVDKFLQLGELGWRK